MKFGDSWLEIARKLFNDAQYAPSLIKANKDILNLRPGQVIRVPPTISPLQAPKGQPPGGYNPPDGQKQKGAPPGKYKPPAPAPPPPDYIPDEYLPPTYRPKPRKQKPKKEQPELGPPPPQYVTPRPRFDEEQPVPVYPRPRFDEEIAPRGVPPAQQRPRGTVVPAIAALYTAPWMQNLFTGIAQRAAEALPVERPTLPRFGPPQGRLPTRESLAGGGFWQRMAENIARVRGPAGVSAAARQTRYPPAPWQNIPEGLGPAVGPPAGPGSVPQEFLGAETYKIAGLEKVIPGYDPAWAGLWYRDEYGRMFNAAWPRAYTVASGFARGEYPSIVLASDQRALKLSDADLEAAGYQKNEEGNWVRLDVQAMPEVTQEWGGGGGGALQQRGYYGGGNGGGGGGGGGGYSVSYPSYTQTGRGGGGVSYLQPSPGAGRGPGGMNIRPGLFGLVNWRI